MNYKIKDFLNKRFLKSASVVCFFLLASCSGKKVDENNPQSLFDDAVEDVQDKKYSIALDKLKTIKNKFPYSHLAMQAKLKIADVYFMEESFIEAAGSYETFRDLHPKHEKADYVLFRIGESYFFQLPSTEDKDLTAATKAIDAYQELLTLFPNTQYKPAAAEHLKASTDFLAKKEKYIADFYFKNEMFDSAASRYEKITNKFSGSSFDEYAYNRWAQSLIFSNKLDEAKHVYRVYISRYPSGEYAKRAGDWLEQNGGI